MSRKSDSYHGKMKGTIIVTYVMYLQSLSVQNQNCNSFRATYSTVFMRAKAEMMQAEEKAKSK